MDGEDMDGEPLEMDGEPLDMDGEPLEMDGEPLGDEDVDGETMEEGGSGVDGANGVADAEEVPKQVEAQAASGLPRSWPQGLGRQRSESEWHEGRRGPPAPRAAASSRPSWCVLGPVPYRL